MINYLKRYALIGIFLIAAFLRLLAVHPGFQLTFADEQSTLDIIYNIITQLNFKPHDYYYGTLVPYIFTFFNLVFFIPILLATFIFQNFSDYAITNQHSVFDFFNYFVQTQLKTTWWYFETEHNYFTYWARYQNAILSSLTVIPVYLLGKKL